MAAFQYSRYYPLGRQESFVPEQYYGMPMMAPRQHFEQSSPSDLPVPVPAQEKIPENAAQKKTEERILIELFGENEDRLRYKAYNLPE